MPEPGGSGSAVGRTPGWREVAVVGAVVVGSVLGLAVLTSVLPVGLQDVVFRTPLAIAILVVGTVGLLARLARLGRRGPDDGRGPDDVRRDPDAGRGPDD